MGKFSLYTVLLRMVVEEDVPKSLYSRIIILVDQYSAVAVATNLCVAAVERKRMVL
jgi:hypothetical protein